MQFSELKLKDRTLFEQTFCLNNYELSTYNFNNIFIWKDAFKIFYIILNGYVCVFFKDKNGCFMYLPPLPFKMPRYTGIGGSAEDHRLSAIKICFKIMDSFNSNKNISRIENVDENNLAFFRECNYAYLAKPGDYIYKRDDLTSLRGERFKSKRSSYNYFVRHYDFKFNSFSKQNKDECLALYQQWAKQRKVKFSDNIYQAMLEEGFRCQRLAMDNFAQLGLVGYLIKIKNKIIGYTLGYPINNRMFCILFEACDLNYKGVSQFIFSEFCQQLSGYKYINIMDDSGLDNLRKVKLSYHPICVLANYIIKKDYA